MCLQLQFIPHLNVDSTGTIIHLFETYIKLQKEKGRQLLHDTAELGASESPMCFSC